MHAGCPGCRTPMLIPSCGKRASPSKRVYAPKSPSFQTASFALTTNHPSPSGTRPAFVSPSGASGTTEPGYREPMDVKQLQALLAGEPPYRAHQVWEWAARGAEGYGAMTN